MCVLTRSGVCHWGSLCLNGFPIVVSSYSIVGLLRNSVEVANFAIVVVFGGVEVVSLVRNRGCVVDAGRDLAHWTIQLNTLGSLDRYPLEEFDRLPDAQHELEHWIQVRDAASYLGGLTALDCEVSCFQMKNPCCSVANLSGQPLISVGSTGSVDVYHDWVWFVRTVRSWCW
jgi:hypothetical protein